MKKLYSLLILIISCTTLFAQEKGNITGKYYVANVDIRVIKYNYLNQTYDSNDTYIAKAGTKFTAYEINGGKILIKFWNFRDTTENPKGTKNTDNFKRTASNKDSQNEPVFMSSAPTYNTAISTTKITPVQPLNVSSEGINYSEETEEETESSTNLFNLNNEEDAVTMNVMSMASSQSEPISLSFAKFDLIPESNIYKGRYISFETNGDYFLIDAKDFNTKTSEFNGRTNSFAWGFSTLPIKLRFGGKERPFEYSTGFSLGINAGYEYQFKSRVKQSIGLLLGMGVSTVLVSPESTNSVINKSTTTGAFVPTLSLIYSYSNFQIGTFVGADFIPGEIGKNWVYRNSPWLGLGLGFTIFQRNKSEMGNEPSQASR